MARVILHIDMDAFFAAVEQREHPELKGKPVIIGADPKEGKGRGVVSTCSYEARPFGVHSAMPISEAYRKCPHGIYLPPNGKLYRQVSENIFDIYNRYTDAVEPLSIDEAFLDVTGSTRLFGEGRQIAEQIKDAIVREHRLTASVGVACNKYLAKIASDLDKPDGLVEVAPDAIDAFLSDLHISRLWGAGKQTQKIFQHMGIKTIGQLARYPLPTLTHKFGKLGQHFYNLAHGIDEREVSTLANVKSVSNEHTFGQDTNVIATIENTLFHLAGKVGYRLRKKGLAGKTIHLKLRYDNFNTITRNKTLPKTTDNTQIIYDTVKWLFEQNYQSGRKVRLLGVGVSGFEQKGGKQKTIFDMIDEKNDRLNQIEDLLVDRYGDNIISRAENLNRKRNK
ncbi:MAG: DNA polymerase IV [Caldithrix sp.]|nr:DNA polymerase IV [Caldithrix sp.]